MSQFSDRPFVAGSLVGLRAFKVDAFGRLCGPSHGGVFTPGENVAECKRPRVRVPADAEVTFQSWSGGGNPFRTTTFVGIDYGIEVKFPDGSTKTYPSDTAVVAESDEGKHSLSGTNCTCGFYAYFDGGNDFADEKTVSAVVEGYGVCAVGTRGFRAEKARLLALVVPKVESLAFWDRHGLKVLAAFAAFNTVNVVRHIAAQDWTWLAVSALGAASLVASGFWHSKTVARKMKRIAKTNRSAPFDLALRNYPDVPVYPTVKAALAAHPLTPPPPPSPETDDDFWTRSAS